MSRQVEARGKDEGGEKFGDEGMKGEDGGDAEGSENKRGGGQGWSEGGGG